MSLERSRLDENDGTRRPAGTDKSEQRFELIGCLDHNQRSAVFKKTTLLIGPGREGFIVELQSLFIYYSDRVLEFLNIIKQRFHSSVSLSEHFCRIFKAFQEIASSPRDMT